MKRVPNKYFLEVERAHWKSPRGLKLHTTWEIMGVNWSLAREDSLADELFKQLRCLRRRKLSTGGRFYLTVKNSSVTAWNIFTVTWSAWMGHKCFKCSLKEHLLGLLPEVTSSLDQAVRSDDFYGALRWGDCVTLEVCYLLSVNAPKQSGTAIWHWASNFCHRWGQSKRLRVWEGWADVALASFLNEVAVERSSNCRWGVG